MGQTATSRASPVLRSKMLYIYIILFSCCVIQSQGTDTIAIAEILHLIRTHKQEIINSLKSFVDTPNLQDEKCINSTTDIFAKGLKPEKSNTNSSSVLEDIVSNLISLKRERAEELNCDGPTLSKRTEFVERLKRFMMILKRVKQKSEGNVNLLAKGTPH